MLCYVDRRLDLVELVLLCMMRLLCVPILVMLLLNGWNLRVRSDGGNLVILVRMD